MITRNRTEVIGIASVVCFFILLLIVGSGHATSVDVGGWNFTADLGAQWRLGTQPMSEGEDIPSLNTEATFTGVMKKDALWLPRDNTVITAQDLPDILDPKQNDIIANVDIRVNKVPQEETGWAAKDILADFYGPPASGSSLKEIEFNGRPALLSESENSDVSIGEISVLMTQDTIVSIDVVTLPKSNLRPWDVIEKFTISPR